MCLDSKIYDPGNFRQLTSQAPPRLLSNNLLKFAIKFVKTWNKTWGNIEQKYTSELKVNVNSFKHITYHTRNRAANSKVVTITIRNYLTDSKLFHYAKHYACVGVGSC